MDFRGRMFDRNPVPGAQGYFKSVGANRELRGNFLVPPGLMGLMVHTASRAAYEPYRRRTEGFYRSSSGVPGYSHGRGSRAGGGLASRTMSTGRVSTRQHEGGEMTAGTPPE